MRILTIATALLLTACAGTTERLASVDAGGGITHIRPQAPAKFVAGQPGLAVPGADFLFVAPIAVSRRGVLKHYLWLAARSTVDRRLTGAAAPAIDRIVVVADGTPVSLDLEPWSAASEAEAYETGLIRTATFAARVTESQLAWLAGAGSVAVITVADNGRETRYSTRAAVAEVFGGFDNPPRVAARADR